MRTNVSFCCIFGHWIQVCFQNFSITHNFRVAAVYMKAQTYVCESRMACRRQSGHIVTSIQSRVIHVWLTVLCRFLARTQCVIVGEVHSVCSTINMPRKCVNSSEAYCYIRGEVTFISRRRLSHPRLRNVKSIISSAKWVIWTRVGFRICVCVCVCHICQSTRGWAKYSRFMTFAIPLGWRQPTDRVADRYFCLTCITGVTAKSKQTVLFYNLLSAIRPEPHSSELPVLRASNKHDAKWQWVKWWRCRPS